MPNPDGSPTLEEAIAAAVAGNLGSAGTMPRDQQRAILAKYGIDMPITMADFTAAAQKYQEASDTFESLSSQPTGVAFGHLADEQTGLTNQQLDDARANLAAAGQALSDLASQYNVEHVGEAPVPQEAYSIFTQYLTPAKPTIAEIPTAEEFMGDFTTAWETELGGLPVGGQNGLTLEEMNWATSYLKPMVLNQYMAHLAASAQPGQSPFSLKEVTREQRGIEPGSAAGTALEQAVGPGVTEPTVIQKELTATAAPKSTGANTASADVERQRAALELQVAETGTGIPKEFQAVPNVMPADFIKTVLTPANIKMLYASSQSGGAASGKTRAPSGAQRVGEIAP